MRRVDKATDRVMLSHTSLDAWITMDGGGDDLAAWAAALLCGPAWGQNMPAFERRRNGGIACTVDVRWSIGQVGYAPNSTFPVYLSHPWRPSQGSRCPRRNSPGASRAP
jgi:hypothetical protein